MVFREKIFLRKLYGVNISILTYTTPGLPSPHDNRNPGSLHGGRPLSEKYYGDACMNAISRMIHGWLGWCPNALDRKTRTAPVPSPTAIAAVPEPGEPPVPARTAVAAPNLQNGACPENLLLILLLVAGLFSLVDIRLLALFGLICAISVYYDAVILHAGEKFSEETFFGDVVTWRPLTWAVWVLIFSVFFLAVYLFSREDIWKANA